MNPVNEPAASPAAATVARIDVAVQSREDFARLRESFAALPMVPKVLASRDGGVDVSSPGRRTQSMLLGEESAGTMYVAEAHLMPGFGAPPHHQPTEEELWYLVEGRLDIRVGNATATVQPGSFAFIPRHTTHAFRNNGTEPVRLLAWNAPAGHERAFEAMRRRAEQDGAADLKAMAAMLAHYEIDIHADPDESAAHDPLTGTRPDAVDVDVRSAADFGLLRRMLAALPPIPKILPALSAAPLWSWPGQEVRLLLRSEESAGRFNVAEIRLAPHAAVPPHRHAATDKCLYVLEGELELTLAGREQRLAPGGFAFVPRGTVLSARASRGLGARFVEWTGPAGQDRAYACIASARCHRDSLDAEDRQRLAAHDFILE